MIYKNKKKLYFILIEKLLQKGFIMKKLLNWSFVVLCMLCPMFSFSMDEEENAVNACNCSHETLSKALYIFSFFTGATGLSTYAYARISSIAQEHHHPDPISEGYAAFIGTQIVAGTIAAVGYNYYFDNNKPQSVPTLAMNKGPSKTFLKRQAQSSNDKNWYRAIKADNRRRDNARKKHLKVK